MPLWESSIYRFRVPVDNNNPVELKEVVIDVTGSAPNFDTPSENLKTVLEDVLPNEKGYEIESVLEFGAAKLKNVPYILDMGKKVCAVEFESILEYEQTQQNLAKCRAKGPDFQELVFPNPFISDKKQFDLVLLANVLPVMPVPAERLYVIKTIYNKLREGKYLLWVAQKEATEYKRLRDEGRNKLGDGIWIGKKRYIKNFYRYHPPEELDEMMGLFGFQLEKKWGLSDDVRLYKKIPHAVMNNAISGELLMEYLPVDQTIADPTNSMPKIVQNRAARIAEPNPSYLAIESFYKRRLHDLSCGTDYAELYHRLTAWAIARIFRGFLRNMRMKVPIGDGTKIVDTIFTNVATEGFFYNVGQRKIAQFPIFEMKNYANDPVNEEFDQLNGRLNDQRGNFGVLVCRQVDETKAYARCKTFLPNNWILFLTDNDIIQLLQYRSNNDVESINDFMADKLTRLLF
ncbi:MAG: hypothetical protein NWE93_13520 [Candidatus Bathyarchaeota archaeon]|nr:hypothetical protein [Candidatus Bathyarchaeota archaeon]